MFRPIAATVTLTTALPAAADTPHDPASVFRAHPAPAPTPGATTYPAPYLQVSTPANVHIVSPTTRLGVAANLSEAKQYFVVGVATDSSDNGELVGAHVLAAARPTATLRTTVDVKATDLPRLGSYVFGIDAFNDGDQQDSVVYTPTTIRRNSLLGITAARTGDTIKVTASARQYLIPENGYVGWTGRTIGIQRYTSTGWVTIRTATTDSNGNLTVNVNIPFRTALRARDSDTGATWGAVSNSEIR